MKFEKVIINNFRNYENIELDICNRNIFFGLNDVGKTNFLAALRYVFDKDTRRQNLLDSDFHNKNFSKPIEIAVVINIEDYECDDCKKLRAKLKGALQSEDKVIYIKLVAEYNINEMVAIPILYWGGNLENLKEMKQRGYFYELDYVFNVIYIDSYVDLYSLFKKNINQLINNNNEKDSDTLNKIQKTVNSLNEQISALSGIKEFERKLTPEFKKFKNDNINVSIKSEIAVKGLYSNIIPYIKQDGDDELYPTAGEGRKKLLSYSIYDIISNNNAKKKINLFLIEEPENHLHKSMQLALSQILFTYDKYSYLFVTTHSPYILYEMDDVNLIRIYSEKNINSASTFYKVPKTYEKDRKRLNRGLSEAIFASRVLLVEGPSEFILFNKILSVVNPFYEAEGIYILAVNGINFKIYVELLNKLQITNIIKTDNDLRSTKKEKTDVKSAENKKTYELLGFSRCNRYIGEELLPIVQINENSIEARRKLYDENKEKLDEIRADYKIHLSRVDLENDLDECIPKRLEELLNHKEPVEWLQKLKCYNMVELIEKLSDDDLEVIYNSYNFACLREVCNDIKDTTTNYKSRG